MTDITNKDLEEMRMAFLDMFRARLDTPDYILRFIMSETLEIKEDNK